MDGVCRRAHEKAGNGKWKWMWKQKTETEYGNHVCQKSSLKHASEARRSIEIELEKVTETQHIFCI